MMKYKIVIFLTVILTIFVGSFLFWKIKYSPKKATDEVHFHAGFQVYINNQLQDYSSFKFMHIDPCGQEDHEQKEDEQIEKAHLHDGIGDIVHVHRANAKWSDLFKNIIVSIGDDAVGYINGILVENFLDTTIAPFDSLVVFEEENDDLELKLSKAVTKSQITEIEAKSENCGS